MSRRVVWTRASLTNLAMIRTYLAERNPYAADRVFDQLLAAGNSLADHPDRGRPFNGNLRELVSANPYLIRYRVQADTVQIIHIRHGARRPVNALK